MTKPCDACQSGNAVIYCRADAAFLCSSCDGKVHGANKLASRHERVVMCEVCEHAPAVVTCKADAAALCVNCDNDIHSANPLARRHERVPVTPFYESSPANIALKFAHRGLHQSDDEEQQCSLLLKDEEEEESSAAEAASWLLPHPNNVSVKVLGEDEVDEDVKGGGTSDHSTEQANFSDVPVTVVENTTSNNSASNNNNSTSSNFFTPSKLGGGAVKEKLIKSQQNFDLFSDVDPYLDMDFVSALGALHPVTDSLVPIHGTEVLGDDASPVQSNTSDSYDLELQHKSGHNFCAELSLSTSSIDVGVVPDASLSDISTPQSRPTSMFDLPHHQHQQQQQQRPAPLQHATPLEPMAREARVLRYREKRKNRKFEKTIRYASRKAYAETRPRIKGRFAKRSEIDVEQMYAVVPDGAFGVVPSY